MTVGVQRQIFEFIEDGVEPGRPGDRCYCDQEVVWTCGEGGTEFRYDPKLDGELAAEMWMRTGWFYESNRLNREYLRELQKKWRRDS